MRPPLHIAFAGGGTPGQLHPGLAVAAHIVERVPEAAVTFVGAGKSLEPHTVRAAGYHYTTLPSSTPSRHPLHALRFVTDNVAGFWASRWFLKEQQVSLVVGLGGYSSAATVFAAAARGIPTVLLEQNVVPTRVTRWLARSAEAVCAGFDAVRQHLPADVPLRITGNPARPEFEQLYRRVEADPTLDVDPTHVQATEKRLVVLGGSSGPRGSASAQTLNQFMPRALSRLGALLDGWRIVHQTGEGQLQETERRYRAAGVEALVVSYIDEVAPVLFETDLVVCRAGGTTLAELALAGVPAILVPDARAAEASQRANADILAAAGACAVIDEMSLTSPLDQALVDQLQPLVLDQACRREMAANIRRFARPDAASQITGVICDILRGQATQLAA